MKFRYIDKLGQLAVPGEFTWAGSFRGGLACVRNEMGRYYVVDRSGETVFQLPAFQREATYVSEGFVLVTDNKKYGFVDLHGKLVIPTMFSFANHFSEGVALVRTRMGYNFLSPAGDCLLPNPMEQLGDFHDGNALGRIKEKWYYAKHDGDFSLGPYEYGYDFAGGVAKVSNERTYFHIDTNGNFLFAETPGRDTSPFCFQGFISFFAGKKQGFLDKQGNVVIPPIYDAVGMFNEGVAVVKRGGKPLVIDANGRVLLSPDCDELEFFSEGMAVYRRGGGFGYLNRIGEVIIDATFQVASPFREGVAVVGMA